MRCFQLKVNRGCIWWNSSKCRQAHILGNISCPTPLLPSSTTGHIRGSTNVHNKSLQSSFLKPREICLHHACKVKMHYKGRLSKENSGQKHFIVKLFKTAHRANIKSSKCSDLLCLKIVQNKIQSFLVWIGCSSMPLHPYLDYRWAVTVGWWSDTWLPLCEIQLQPPWYCTGKQIELNASER